MDDNYWFEHCKQDQIEFEEFCKSHNFCYGDLLFFLWSCGLSIRDWFNFFGVNKNA